MSVQSLSQLYERTLVIVAHPDDEFIAAGALLQRIHRPLIVFCTDGAPFSPSFWQAYRSRQQYAQTRRKEAGAAAKAIGIGQPAFLAIVDQELHLNLGAAYQALEKVVGEFSPMAILTLAYEGGHPDHDCCAFLSRILSAQHNLPVWEAPLYHRTAMGACQQEFLFPAEGTTRLCITASELSRKHSMAAAYRSQAKVLETFDLNVELLRPQFPYDFLNPPTTEINYEAWKWQVTSRQVSDAFRYFLSHLGFKANTSPFFSSISS